MCYLVFYASSVFSDGDRREISFGVDLRYFFVFPIKSVNYFLVRTASGAVRRSAVTVFGLVSDGDRRRWSRGPPSPGGTPPSCPPGPMNHSVATTTLVSSVRSDDAFGV